MHHQHRGEAIFTHTSTTTRLKLRASAWGRDSNLDIPTENHHCMSAYFHVQSLLSVCDSAAGCLRTTVNSDASLDSQTDKKERSAAAFKVVDRVQMNLEGRKALSTAAPSSDCRLIAEGVWDQSWQREALNPSDWLTLFIYSAVIRAAAGCSRYKATCCVLSAAGINQSASSSGPFGLKNSGSVAQQETRHYVWSEVLFQSIRYAAAGCV